MKGISQQKAKENSIRYRAMYSQWSDSGTTLEQLVRVQGTLLRC